MTEMLSMRWLHAARSARLGGLSATPYAVNIGCWDGKSFNDPVYPLYLEGFAGVAIEWGDPPELAENLGGLEGVTLLPNTYVTPASICSVLTKAGCPAVPDFLKLDIDGMDGDVLAALLAGGFRPLALHQAASNQGMKPGGALVVDEGAWRADARVRRPLFLASPRSRGHSHRIEAG